MGEYLNLDVANVEEPKPVAAGEYKLEIIHTEIKESKKSGKPYLSVGFAIADNEDAETIFHVLMLPHAEEDPKNKKMFQRNLKRFAQAFDAPLEGEFDIESLKGNTGFAILAVEEDEEYGERNVIKRFVQSA